MSFDISAPMAKEQIAELIHDAILAANNAGYQDARYIAGEIKREDRDRARNERDAANRALWSAYWGREAIK